HALETVGRTGILSTLFAVSLLASGQNATITGTLTGQIVMEGFIHMKMPIWARRLVTRLLAVIPVLACVTMTQHSKITQQHEAINNLMNNSQVFLAFALPFSMVPLLLLTNEKTTMKHFQNRIWLRILGWISVIAMIYLNLVGLPDQVEAFFPTKSKGTADLLAYFIIIVVLALLLWMIIEFKRNKNNKASQAL
ncbi:divalent metal cation transporter, partial [Lactococcus lactis]